MKKTILLLSLLICIVLSLGVSVVLYNPFSWFTMDEELYVGVNENMLYVGSKFKQDIDNKTLVIEKNSIDIYNITSTTPMIHVGDIIETKEWEYHEKGIDIIKGNEPLTWVDTYIACPVSKVERYLISNSNGVQSYGNKCPDGIKYPRNMIANPDKKDVDDPDFIDGIIRTQEDEYTLKVNRTMDYYDPTAVNYTGDCSSTCEIIARTYNATLTEGVITHTFWEVDGYSLDWVEQQETGSSNHIGDLRSSVALIDGVIDVSAVEKNETDFVNIYISNGAAHNNWSFYGTYIQLESIDDSDFSVIHTISGDTVITKMDIYNGTTNYNPTANPYQTDGASTLGVAGYDDTDTDFFYAVAFDEAVETDFDYRTHNTNSYVKIVHGRGGGTSEISANNKFKLFIKVFPKNLSAAGNEQVNSYLRAFKGNPTFNDTILADETPPVITINNPTNNTNLTAGTLWTWINITTNENANCSYSNFTDKSITEMILFTNTSGQIHSFNFSNSSTLNNGNIYTLFYRCNDTIGNNNSVSAVHIFGVDIVDVTAPIVALISPANNSAWDTDNTPDFKYSASDNIAITNCSLFINETFNASFVDNTNFTNIPVSDGSYTWFVNCSDAAGNWGHSGTYNLLVNATAVSGFPGIPDLSTITSSHPHLFFNNESVASLSAYFLGYDDAPASDNAMETMQASLDQLYFTCSGTNYKDVLFSEPTFEEECKAHTIWRAGWESMVDPTKTEPNIPYDNELTGNAALEGFLQVGNSNRLFDLSSQAGQLALARKLNLLMRGYDYAFNYINETSPNNISIIEAKLMNVTLQVVGILAANTSVWAYAGSSERHELMMGLLVASMTLPHYNVSSQTFCLFDTTTQCTQTATFPDDAPAGWGNRVTSQDVMNYAYNGLFGTEQSVDLRAKSPSFFDNNFYNQKSKDGWEFGTNKEEHGQHMIYPALMAWDFNFPNDSLLKELRNMSESNLQIKMPNGWNLNYQEGISNKWLHSYMGAFIAEKYGGNPARFLFPVRKIFDSDTGPNNYGVSTGVNNWYQILMPDVLWSFWNQTFEDYFDNSVITDLTTNTPSQSIIYPDTATAIFRNGYDKNATMILVYGNRRLNDKFGASGHQGSWEMFSNQVYMVKELKGTSSTSPSNLPHADPKENDRLGGGCDPSLWAKTAGGASSILVDNYGAANIYRNNQMDDPAGFPNSFLTGYLDYVNMNITYDEEHITNPDGCGGLSEPEPSGVTVNRHFIFPKDYLIIVDKITGVNNSHIFSFNMWEGSAGTKVAGTNFINYTELGSTLESYFITPVDITQYSVSGDDLSKANRTGKNITFLSIHVPRFVTDSRPNVTSLSPTSGYAGQIEQGTLLGVVTVKNNTDENVSVGLIDTNASISFTQYTGTALEYLFLFDGSEYKFNDLVYVNTTERLFLTLNYSDKSNITGKLNRLADNLVSSSKVRLYSEDTVTSVTIQDSAISFDYDVSSKIVNFSTSTFGDIIILAGTDVTAPTITNLRNTSTTNESSHIEWDTNEAANYTFQLYNNSERTNLLATTNNTNYLTSRDLTISNLINSTTYYINLTACDSSGNCADNNTFNFTTANNIAAVDSTNPNATIGINNTSPKINEDINISSNVTDETELAQCWFNNNFTNTNSTPIDLSGTSDSCFNITKISATRGETINFTVYVNDTSGNLHFNWTTVTISNTAPTFNESLTNQEVIIPNSLNYQVNCSDVDYGDTITYSDNSTLFNIDSATGEIIDTPTESQAGIYDIRITCVDGVGQRLGTFQYTITDVTSPVITNLRNTSTTNQSSVIEWNTNENANYTIRIYNGSQRSIANLTNQTDNNTFATSHNPFFDNLLNSTDYFINLTVCDSSGNCADNNTFNFTTETSEDANHPSYTNFQNNASATDTGTGSKVNISLDILDNVQLDFYVCANNQSGTLTNGTAVDISGTTYPISNIITVTQLAGENVSYNCWFNDTSGNTNTTVLGYFKVESTAPTISSVTSSSVTDKESTITWTTNEISNSTVLYGITTNLGLEEEISLYVTSHPIGLTGLTPFTLYYYNVTSCDASGNCATSIQYFFTLERNRGILYTDMGALSDALIIFASFFALIFVVSVMGFAMYSFMKGDITVEELGIIAIIIVLVGIVIGVGIVIFAELGVV